jgi:hypothetical protein
MESIEIETKIREYNEGLPVEIEKSDGSYKIKARNEGGYCYTAVDLVDVILWAKEFLPGLFDEIRYDCRR